MSSYTDRSKFLGSKAQGDANPPVGDGGRLPSAPNNPTRGHEVEGQYA